MFFSNKDPNSTQSRMQAQIDEQDIRLRRVEDRQFLDRARVIGGFIALFMVISITITSDHLTDQQRLYVFGLLATAFLGVSPTIFGNQNQSQIQPALSNGHT